MRLYHDPIATTCRPVTFLAAHVGLELELCRVDLLLGEQDRPAFRTINPQGAVPVLVDGDFTLTESTAILRYLATEHAPHLYPAERRQRARIDELLGWSSTSLNVAVGVLTVYPQALGMPRGLGAETVTELGRVGMARIYELLGQLDVWLATRRFCAGQTLSIADFHVLSTLTLADLIGFDYDRWEEICRWIATMRALSGWQESYAGFKELAQTLRPGSAASGF